MEPITLSPKNELTEEEVFIAVYCCVDEWYGLLFGGQHTLRLSNNGAPHFTDMEVITIALVGELSGADSQNGWYRYVRKNYLSLFPRLCDRTRYGRRLRRLKSCIAHIHQHLCFLLGADCERYRIVDSLPIELARLVRLSSSCEPFGNIASVGYCASKKLHYYGVKLQLLCDLRGIPTYAVVTCAHLDDRPGFEALVQELCQAGLRHLSLIVVADKGYVGQDFCAQIKEVYGLELLPIQRHYHKEEPVRAINTLLKKSRRIIETTNNVLNDLMHIESTKSRSINGFATAIVAKLAAFNLGCYFNMLLGEPLLQVKGFIQ